LLTKRSINALKYWADSGQNGWVRGRFYPGLSLVEICWQWKGWAGLDPRQQPLLEGFTAEWAA
jgi:hypothetical protein